MKNIFLVVLVFFLTFIINLSGCIEERSDESIKFSIVSFNIEPNFVNKGEKAIINWEVLKAKTVKINNGIGSVDNKGNITIYPHETTIYQLTAQNETKIKVESFEITVIENIENDESDRDINITPSITVTKDESDNSIRFVQVESGVNWNQINITASDISNNYFYIEKSGILNVGDTLYFDGNGLSGFITIRFWYIPNNDLIGTYNLNGVIK